MKKRYWEEPPATKTQIKKFVKDSLESRDGIIKYIFLGKPSNIAIKRIKKATGYDIDKVTLSSDYVIHALKDEQFKKHKLFPDDITRIMTIINDENTIIRISKLEHQNKKPIEFIGYVNGKIILVEAVKEEYKELRFVDLYRPKHEENKSIGDARMQVLEEPPSAHVRNASPPKNNIVNSTPNVKKNPTKTKTKKTQPNTKKTLVNKNSKLITNEEQKEKAMATKQKRKTTKRKLSPAQLAALEKGRKTRAKNLAAKKAAQKKKTSTRKNPVKKKTPAKKTATRKPATRRTPARKTPAKTPAKKPASRKPTVRKNPFVAGATYTDVPEPPKFNKSKAIYVGRLPSLEYITEAGTNSPRPYKFKHEFEEEIPYLVSDGDNLFIVKGNKKMHFDPKRGIVG